MYTRSLAKAFGIANSTVVIFFLVHSLRRVSLHTLLNQTRMAPLLSIKSRTRVTTPKHLVTRLLHLVYTLRLSTHIRKCLLLRRRWLSYLSLTISALSGSLEVFELVASFPQMVRLCLAVGAEIFIAFGAAHSEFTHMLSRFSARGL